MMELLNEEIKNSENFSFLCSFFNGSIKNDQVEYDEFRENIIKLTEFIMRNYLKGTPYCKNLCLCLYTDKITSSGSFNPKYNIIIIREDLIKSMYKNKKWDLLSVVFHELNHFKFKYDINLGYLDENIVRIIKENLISQSPLYPSFIKMGREAESTYYKDNYKLFSEEKLADLNSLDNLLVFLKKANIPLTNQHKKNINNFIVRLYHQYENQSRDVHNNLNFNSYVIDFEEAFDILIKDNPRWLEYEQLQIEYYLDEHGKVLKRSEDELKILLNKETDLNRKQYIEKLLNKKKKNFSSFTKRSILDYKINFNDLKPSNKL